MMVMVTCLGQNTWPSVALLAKEFSAQWKFRSKQLIADIVGDDSNSTETTGSLSVSRWSLKNDSVSALQARLDCDVHARAGYFQYAPSAAGDVSTHWHMNFADPDVFAYYGGELLAQDELQCVEHPILASICLALVTKNDANLSAQTVDDDGRATPVLVKGAPRRCALDTTYIYGDNFAEASNELLRDSVTKLQPPTISNIVAIASVDQGDGKYTASEILHIFETALTGFRAIVKASDNNEKATLHTGHWGCGAFGGNKGLMAAVQILAAGTAGVSHVYYWYGFTELDKSATSHGFQVAQLLHGQTIEKVCQLLESAGYYWGDGNENHVPFEPPENCLLSREKK